MELDVPSWYHCKAWLEDGTMMEPNGTKEPGYEQRKPGIWYHATPIN